MRKTVRFHRRRVALLIESSRAYGRATLSGVARYIRQHAQWSVFLQEQSLCDDLPDWFANWRGDGIITRMENSALAGTLKKLGVPVVYLRNISAAVKAPSVLTDNPAVSKMAFEHLRERGFRHFAFCGYNGADYSDERRDSFVQFVTEAGLRCHVFSEPLPDGEFNTAAYEEAGLKDGPLVAQWVQQLPKPVGLMACNDMRGQQVLNACRTARVAVPDDVAVIGADNEEVLCDLSEPPLSSVVPNGERVGYEAAELLDRLMHGQPVRAAPTFIGPNAVVARRSTDVLAIEDRQIAAAVHFIREHACENIDVGDILRAVPLSRSTLERRYEKILGRSPKQDILRFRLNRAKQLLVETDMTLDAIAEKVGLEHTEYLGRIFKKKFGLTPAKFRAGARMADANDQLPASPARGIRI
jgi:LacI family transcriptional regulator